MTQFWSRLQIPAEEAAQHALRRRLDLPRMVSPHPDPARLNRAADAALRQLRNAAVMDSGFGWLLSPRVAMALIAMAIAGGAVGAGWPVAQASASTDTLALLDSPNSIPADLTP